MNNKYCNREQLLAEFKTIPLFSALTDEQVEKVIQHTSQIELSNGEKLFYQGQEAESFYLLESGQIQLFLESEDGNEKVIDVVHPGQIFAEAVIFLEGQTYPVNAQAMQKCTLIAINITAFRTLLKDSVDTCFRLLAAMSKRLHIQLKEIDALALHNATYRLVHHLLKSVPEDSPSHAEFILDYPKNVLASRLSIKPETLSRILARLKHRNIINVLGHQIILQDIKALQTFLSEQALQG